MLQNERISRQKRDSQNKLPVSTRHRSGSFFKRVSAISTRYRLSVPDTTLHPELHSGAAVLLEIASTLLPTLRGRAAGASPFRPRREAGESASGARSHRRCSRGGRARAGRPGASNWTRRRVSGMSSASTSARISGLPKASRLRSTPCDRLRRRGRPAGNENASCQRSQPQLPILTAAGPPRSGPLSASWHGLLLCRSRFSAARSPGAFISTGTFRLLDPGSVSIAACGARGRGPGRFRAGPAASAARRSARRSTSSRAKAR